MSFAGLSLISDGKLVGGQYSTPIIDAGAASGYHLLVVEGNSRTRGPPDHNAISCRPFTIGGHWWRIHYYPNGFRKEDAGFIALRLSNEDGIMTNTAVKARFEFSFVDETEKQLPARIHGGKVFDFRGCTPHGNNRFMARDLLEKSEHLKDGSFTIRCDVVVLNPTCTTPPFVPVPPSETHQNLTDLLLSGEGTDVVFQVGGQRFPVHRCVLAARSAVFRALLFGAVKESAPRLVRIDDMEASVFKALLGFIYGDSLPALAAEDDSILLFQHLLEAAHEYGLLRLRAMCQNWLCEHIGVGTASTILVLAEQHRYDMLKETCYNFLRCPVNLKAVVATVGFEQLCRSCPSVIKDLILNVLQAPR